MNLQSSPKNVSTLWLLLWAILAVSCTKEKLYTDALSPEQALDSFQLHEGFDIEIFATEPHVMDPVSMIFDEQGNVFVVEMPDYPYKPKEGEARGRIKMLIDSDDDGRIDESVVFADKLSEATSILPWKDGLLVTSAPNILYLKDTDGDHRADLTEILFSGFFANNSEAQITNLRFGVDNWIYAANHGQAGEVNFSRTPEAPPLSMQGGDFRFRLDRDTFELTTGPAQFGLTMDDWGHRFITQNTIHIRHAVVPKRYVDRHANLPASTAAFNISDHDLRMFQLTPPPYWRAERTRRRQQQYKEQGLDRVEYAEDHFSGASGGTIYTGDAFPKEYYGNIFTGDVSGNLVHRDVLTALDDSPTFVASRHVSEKEQEFLASTDPWFRPVNFTVGPDGYLYVIDMYRQHIETPVSIPEDLKEDMDFLNGIDKGRIYRIKPTRAEAQKMASPKLKEMKTEELVALLAHPNQWWRLQAQRLLLERQELSIVPAIKTMLKHPDARARLHAFYVLEGLSALDDKLVERAMTDAHPGMREHGAILAERFPNCLPQLIKSVEDSSARVAFQASLSLGEFPDREAVMSALARVAEHHAADPWFKIAVLSSKVGSSSEFLKRLSQSASFFQDTTAWKVNFLKDLSYAIGSENNPDEVVSLLDQLASMEDDWQSAGSQGLTEGLKKHEANAELTATLEGIAANAATAPEKAIQNLRALYSSSM